MAKGLKTGENCLLTPHSGFDRISLMPGETENQFSLTCAALSTRGGQYQFNQ